MPLGARSLGPLVGLALLAPFYAMAAPTGLDVLRPTPEAPPVVGQARADQEAIRREIEHLRVVNEEQIAGIRADLGRIVEGANRISEEARGRIYDLSSMMQLLVSVLVLVIGGLLAALMALWQRLTLLERSRRVVPEPASPTGLHSDSATHDRRIA